VTAAPAWILAVQLHFDNPAQLHQCSSVLAVACGSKGDNIAVSHECELSPEGRFVFESAGWVQGQSDASSFMLQMFTIFECLFNRCSLCKRYPWSVHVFFWRDCISPHPHAALANAVSPICICSHHWHVFETFLLDAYFVLILTIQLSCINVQVFLP
jgi:hypothetical protein